MTEAFRAYNSVLLAQIKTLVCDRYKGLRITVKLNFVNSIFTETKYVRLNTNGDLIENQILASKNI